MMIKVEDECIESERICGSVMMREIFYDFG